MPPWHEYGVRVPLWDAVYNQDAATFQKILATAGGATQVNIAHGMWMQTSVHLAVQKGNAKMLKALLFTSGNAANARMINGTTPLHLAIQLKRKDMVKDLLLVGANPLLRNTNKTAIDMARQLRLLDVVSWLEQAVNSLPLQRELKKEQK